MGNLITLKINPLAKEKLDAVKKKHSFSSFGVAIDAMCSFFELNKISPKDGLNQGYQNSIFNVEKAVKIGLFEMKKQFTKDSQSMRKLMRAIEKDHIVGTSTKVSYLYNEHKEENVKKSVENSFNNMVAPSKDSLEKDREIEILKDTIEVKNDELKKLKYAQGNEDTLALKYEEILKTIYRNYKTEKSVLGGKERLYIEMTKKDFDKLFDF